MELLIPVAVREGADCPSAIPGRASISIFGRCMVLAVRRYRCAQLVCRRWCRQVCCCWGGGVVFRRVVDEEEVVSRERKDAGCVGS